MVDMITRHHGIVEPLHHPHRRVASTNYDIFYMAIQQYHVADRLEH